jgi:hypothetical protein
VKLTLTLQSTGKTTAGFEIPPEVVEALGGGKRPPVTVTINGFTYRNSIAPMGGSHWLGVSAENRAGAGVAAGDVVELDLALDTAPRTVEVPADFAGALAAVPAARAFFDSISYSNQRWHVLQVEGAKAAETRAKRIEKSVAMLAEGRAR